MDYQQLRQTPETVVAVVAVVHQPSSAPKPTTTVHQPTRKSQPTTTVHQPTRKSHVPL